MPSQSQRYSADSPLDHLAQSRVSIGSVNSLNGGILDALPITKDMLDQLRLAVEQRKSTKDHNGRATASDGAPPHTQPQTPQPGSHSPQDDVSPGECQSKSGDSTPKRGGPPRKRLDEPLPDLPQAVQRVQEESEAKQSQRSAESHKGDLLRKDSGPRVMSSPRKQASRGDASAIMQSADDCKVPRKLFVSPHEHSTSPVGSRASQQQQQQRAVQGHGWLDRAPAIPPVPPQFLPHNPKVWNESDRPTESIAPAASSSTGVHIPVHQPNSTYSKSPGLRVHGAPHVRALAVDPASSRVLHSQFKGNRNDAHMHSHNPLTRHHPAMRSVGHGKHWQDPAIVDHFKPTRSGNDFGGPMTRSSGPLRHSPGPQEVFVDGFDFQFESPQRPKHVQSRSLDSTPQASIYQSRASASHDDLHSRSPLNSTFSLALDDASSGTGSTSSLREPPSRFDPMSLSDHIEMGVYQIEAGNEDWALHHWRFASEQGSGLAALLYSVALFEGWGSDPFVIRDRADLVQGRKEPDCSAVDPKLLVAAAKPPCPRITLAMKHMATKYRRDKNPQAAALDRLVKSLIIG